MKNKNFDRKNLADKFVSTLTLLIQVLGFVCVIPFYNAVLGQGGALFGYAYTIYSLFLALSVAGIPMAIKQITSEYQTLGYYNIKRRAFIIGKKIALLVGFCLFLVLVIGAPLIARFILGDLVGGNTIQEVTFAIRIISIVALTAPVLSIYKGYFEGHRLVNYVKNAGLIEKAIGSLVIIIASIITIKSSKVNASTGVSIALAGMIVGTVTAYIYLVEKKSKNKKKFEEKIRKVNEPIITDKVIAKKIVRYAIPFILIDLFKALYGYVDIVTVVKGLSKANFSVMDAEEVMGILTVFGAVFNSLLVVIAVGVSTSVVPGLMKSFAKKNLKEINAKINDAFSILVFLIVPLAIGISFLAEPIWMLFYGPSKYGPSVLAYFIFTGVFFSLLVMAISISQALNNYKIIYFSMIPGVLVKILLNTVCINAFYKLGLPAYYGAITTSIVAYLLSFVISLVMLRVKYKVEYEEALKHFMDILCGCMLMFVFLILMKLVVPISSSIRIVNLLLILLYSIVGTFIYLVFALKVGIIKDLFSKKKKDSKREIVV